MPKKCNKIITTERAQILVTMIKCPNRKPTIAFKKILIVWSSDRSITYHIYTSDNELSVIKTHTFVSILWHIKAVFLHFVWEFSQVMEIKEKWMADNWPSQIPCSPWQGWYHQISWPTSLQRPAGNTGSIRPPSHAQCADIWLKDDENKLIW